MADYIQVPPDSTGKKVLAKQFTVDATPVLVQGVQVVDRLDPTLAQAVDNKGAANVRFAEGQPAMNLFANLKTAHSKIWGVYEHTTESYDSLFSTELLVGGTTTHIANEASVILAVTGASGSKAMRTTHRFHYYQPGNALLILMTTACGDTGKVGNTRRWGYYSDKDGPFFELLGTGMNVVLRTATSGVAVDERVAQADWNGDKLDGTGLSGITLDVTKLWIYWIDLAWLGAGAVRMGIFGPNGDRIVCHTFRNSGAHPMAYMRKATLPVRWENVNTGVTGSTSELRESAAVVLTEGTGDYTFWRQSDMGVVSRAVTTNTPLFSVRSKLLLASGLSNHLQAYPETLAIHITGGPLKLTLVECDSPDLTGATWAIPGQSTIEGDNAATAINAASPDYWPTGSFYLPAGTYNVDLSKFYELNDAAITTNADHVGQPVLAFVATKLNAGDTVTVTADLTYRELF